MLEYNPVSQTHQTELSIIIVIRRFLSFNEFSRESIQKAGLVESEEASIDEAAVQGENLSLIGLLAARNQRQFAEGGKTTVLGLPVRENQQEESVNHHGGNEGETFFSPRYLLPKKQQRKETAAQDGTYDHRPFQPAGGG